MVHIDMIPILLESGERDEFYPVKKKHNPSHNCSSCNTSVKLVYLYLFRALNELS